MIQELMKGIKYYKLITVIVKKGLATRIVTAAKEAGAGGGTILLGKGAAEEHIYETILGIKYEPEKEIVFIAVEDIYVESVLNIVTREGELNKSDTGIGFVVDLKKCIGIAHLLKSL